MRILGINIRKMDSMIQKNLLEGWFPLGDYPAPTDNGYVLLDPETEEKRNKANELLYGISNNNIQRTSISVCCIAGKNGSGKSTLLDVLFRIINNLAYTFLADTNETPIVYANGVNADLHFEMDGTLGYISCKNEETKAYLGYKIDDAPKEISKTNTDDYIKLRDFFYTISINYSMYAYSSMDYMPKDDKISKLNSGINGKWIEKLFHKNDGYLAPIVLAPFRDKDGNIDMAREKKLANQRLISLILMFKAKRRQFIPGYEPAKLLWRYDENYLKNARGRLLSSTIYGEDKFNRFLNFFIEAWKDYFVAKEFDCSAIQLDNLKHIEKVCLGYLAYKSFKICLTYPEYINLYKIKRKEKGGIKIIVEKMVGTKDHITIKIHQCLQFMYGNRFRKRIGKMSIEKLFEDNDNIKTYNDMMLSLPPSFFYVNIQMERIGGKKEREGNTFPLTFPMSFNLHETFTLESMSSGERQFLNSISYALYHIKNLESVNDGYHRVHYNHVNIILDEAELYYHPEYQRRYIQMLLETLSWCEFSPDKIRSINIIVVTHSPFILSDISHNNVLYLEDGEAVKVNGKTFGANYYDLLYNSFFFDKNAIGEVATRVITNMIQHTGDLKGNEWLLDLLGDPMVKGYLLNKLDCNVQN